MDQRAFFVGPVQVKFSGSPNETKSIASKYISPGEVESDTGELKLNYDKGFCTVDTPCAQGVAAFFSAKPTYSLADVTFASPNEYGAALAVSMDGKAIHDSKKVLVQFGTRSRPTGWVEKPATIQFDNKQSAPGLEVVSYGKAPWQVIKADLVVSIKNTGLKKASVLDMNGNRIADVPLTKAPGAVKFTFPSTAMYVVLEGG